MNQSSKASGLQRFRWPLILLGVPLSAFGIASIAARMSPRPDTLGVHESRLAACPDKPNCVASQATDAEHAMQPIERAGMTAAEAIKTLADRISRDGQAQIVTQSDDYLHVEYSSRLFGFVDDVEFYAPADEDIVHFRSASRLGHSDLGVNRKRMESFNDQPLQSLVD